MNIGCQNSGKSGDRLATARLDRAAAVYDEADWLVGWPSNSLAMTSQVPMGFEDEAGFHYRRSGNMRSQPAFQTGIYSGEPTTILIRAHSRFFSGHPLSRLLGGCGPDRIFRENPHLTGARRMLKIWRWRNQSTKQK